SGESGPPSGEAGEGAAAGRGPRLEQRRLLRPEGDDEPQRAVGERPEEVDEGEDDEGNPRRRHGYPEGMGGGHGDSGDAPVGMIATPGLRVARVQVAPTGGTTA